MSIIGRVDSLWRYPVKSMRGEELTEAFLGFAGVYGDRLYAFHSSTARAHFPYLTGREREEMILFRSLFRDREKAAKPLNLTEAESLGSGVSPLYADLADLGVEVETPTGEVFAVDDPALIRRLAEHLEPTPTLTLLRSSRALTDCRPISLFSVQTVHRLGDELGGAIDKRRFRANVYMHLGSAPGFSEDAFVGRRLRLGRKVVLAVLQRDSRCKMITLDPDTAAQRPEILRKVARDHEGHAGLYAAVLVEGMVHRDDEIELID